MSEVARIVEQLKQAHEGEAWHGPSVGEALHGVTAAAAACSLFFQPVTTSPSPSIRPKPNPCDLRSVVLFPWATLVSNMSTR